MNDQDILKVLQDAKPLLKQGWTQGAYARNTDNKPMDYADPRAVKFCFAGALYKAGGGYGIIEIIQDMISPRPDVMFEWNDDKKRTQKEVLTVLDQAIATFKKKTKKASR